MIFFAVIYEIIFYFPDIVNQTNLIGKFIDVISIERVQDINLILGSFYFPVAIYLFFVLKSSFRFYFAKTTFRAAQKKTRKVDKMNYYLRGLKEYNKFLKRVLHFQLDDLEICSRLSSADSIDESELIKSFNYNNELEPIGYFMRITGNKDLLLRRQLADKIKEAILFAVAIIPLISPLLVTIFPEYSSTLRDLLK